MHSAHGSDAAPLPQKVAIVHDWLPVYAGAERVLEQIIACFPTATVFSMVDLIPPAERGFLGGRPVQTSFLQRWKFVRERYRSFLPFMPWAVEQFDLSSYDLVISSSYAVAKGVITGPDQLHVCYCHSPMRYAWDLQHQYLRMAGLTKGLKSLLARITLHYMRLWDMQTHQRVDHFIANSEFIARRIRKIYGREAAVIHPPVNVSGFPLSEQKEGYYLTVSRLVPYKMIAVIVEAFRQLPHLQLRVIGDGPEMGRIKALAGSNVQLLGFQGNDVVREQMQHAKAFIFAAEEDFGIVPVEAQACGTPVIAFGKGGVLETVQPGRTGVFFSEQTGASIAAAVTEFEQRGLQAQPAEIHAHTRRFAPERFRAELTAFVTKRWRDFVAAKPRREAPDAS